MATKIEEIISGGVGIDKVTEELTHGSHLELFAPSVVEVGTEKKSEYVYKVQGNLDDDGPWTFYVPGESNMYINTNSLRLQGRLRLKMVDSTDGKLKNLTGTEAGKVTLENLFGHTMFNAIAVTMNGFTVSSVSTPHAHYKAYISTLCSYNEHAAKTVLKAAGFDKHTGGFNDEAAKIFDGSKAVTFSAKLHADVLNLDRLMLDKMPLQISLNKTPDAFLIKKKDSTDNNNYKLVVEELELHVDKYQMSESLHQRTIKGLEAGAKVVYPFTRSIIKTYNIAEGSSSLSWNNALMGRKPHQVLIALVEQGSFNGESTKSGFDFKNASVSEMSLSLGGQDYPMTRYKVDGWNEHEIMVAYSKFMKELNSENNNACMITPEMFSSGCTFWSFDLSPDGCAGFHAHDLGTASINVNASFKTATSTNMTVVLFASFSDQFLINSNREIMIPTEPAV